MSTKFVSIASVSRSKSCFFFGVVIRDSFYSPSHRTRSVRNYKVEFFRFRFRMETIFSILHGVEFANFSSSIRFRANKCRNLHKKLKKAFSIFATKKRHFAQKAHNTINYIRQVHLSIFVYTI